MACTTDGWRRIGRALVFAGLLSGAGQANAQVDLRDAATRFHYVIEKVGVIALPTTPPSYSVKVVFAVTNPKDFNTPWDVKNALPFQSSGAQLSLDIGWDPGSDFTNGGSSFGKSLVALGDGAALPVRVTGLTSKTTTTATECNPTDCPGVTGLNRYFATATVTPLPSGSVKTGRVVLEGHPVCNGVPGVSCPPAAVPPAAPYLNIPARTATADFTFASTGTLAAMAANDLRRAIVDINKCKTCHDGNDHGTGIVPQLSLHGANRNENLAACVVCHNANQTDVPYRRATTATEDARIAGPEVPVDFKTMVHSIHAGGFRTQPLVIIGRNSSVNDFSDVRFPRELRDCTNCHIDANGKGTFELPLRAGVLGTTIQTKSTYLTAPRSIDTDPTNDVKISPIAAICSSCHDKAEVKSHMVRTGGASFATTQAAIGTTVRERCASCHGPGKEEDVRRAHEIRGTSGGGRGERRGDD